MSEVIYEPEEEEIEISPNPIEVKTLSELIKQENVLSYPIINNPIISGGMKLNIGSGNKVFKFEPDKGLWMGNTNFNNAVFSVDIDDGKLKCSDVELSNSVKITGLIAGTEIAIQGWQHDMAFTATDHDTVAWAAGTITLLDGTTYNITGANTGDIAAITYIYLDIGTSTTVLQTSTTASNAVGSGKILIAAAENVAAGNNATFQVLGGNALGGLGKLIVASDITANTITANEIAANTITATEINVAQLSAISVDAGTITAGTLQGLTIQTSTSGQRIVLQADDLKCYDASSNVTFNVDAANAAEVARITTPAADSRVGQYFDIGGTGVGVQISKTLVTSTSRGLTIAHAGLGDAMLAQITNAASTKNPISISNSGLGADVRFPTRLTHRVHDFASTGLNDLAGVRNHLWICKSGGSPGRWQPIDFSNFIYRTTFESLDNFYTGFVQDGAAAYTTSATVGYLTLSTGATAGGQAIIHRAISYSGLQWRADRKVRWTARFNFAADTEGSISMGIGGIDQGNNFTDVTEHAGFKFLWNSGTSETDCYCSVANGTQQAHGGTMTFAADTDYVFEIEWLANTTSGDNLVKFYIDGVEVWSTGAHAWMNAIGTSRQEIVLNARVYNETATADRQLILGNWAYWEKLGIK